MKVLICTRWDESHIAELEAAFPQVRFVTALEAGDEATEAADAEVIFGHVSRELSLLAGKLRWVQCQGAGVDWMAKTPELVESDVVVTNTRGAHAATIAEHTMGMLIAMARGFPALVDAQRRHVWVRPLEKPAVGLSGLTMGIIGLGKIGTAIAQRAHAFDMRVIAVDANDVSRPDYLAGFWLLDGLPELLQQSDVVVVTVPYTADTDRMIGPAQLAMMKPTAYLLAISRGGIVDEHALVGALRKRRLAGAGLDVQEQKPVPPDSELWDAPNLFLTPHCSGESRQTNAMATAIFKENLSRYLAGEPLVNLVDKRRGY